MDNNGFPLSTNAQKWAWHQLAQRIGLAPSDRIGPEIANADLPVFYGASKPVTGNIHPALIICRCTVEQWQRTVETGPSTWVEGQSLIPPGSVLPFDNQLPIMFNNSIASGQYDGTEDWAPVMHLEGSNQVLFNIDLLALTFFMFSRWEEVQSSRLDEHGRFPGSASLAARTGFLDFPIIDQFAQVVQRWIQKLLPGWQPQKSKFQVLLSHDIDMVRPFSTPKKATRAFMDELFAGDLYASLKVIRNAQPVKAEQNPYLHSVSLLASLSRQYNLKSAFYFMAAQPAPFDDGYNPAWRDVKQCISRLQSQGCEIGLHAGYHTLDNINRLVAEKNRLEQVTGQPITGGRQHYLRFRPPYTWRDWETAGFEYDSTLGYSDIEGFRCGTCQPFSPFDNQQDRELHLTEIPLIVMDATLRDYRGLSPVKTRERILELARICARLGGKFTLLWHNTSLFGDWQPWAAEYPHILNDLSSL